MRINVFCVNIWLTALALLGFAVNSSALVVTRTSDSVMYIDTSANVWCSYASYQIVNNDGVSYSNLWVKLDSFSSGYVKLGGNDAGQYNLGTLAAGQSNTVFFYLQATNTIATAQNHTLRVYRGRPDVGTQLTNQTFSLTVATSGQNSSTKINTVSAQPNPATVGGLLTITIAGTTGQIGGANKVNFTPAVYTNWNAGAYQLVSCSIDVTGGNVGSYSNAMVITFASPADTTYTAKYWFRAVSVTTTSNSVSPLTIVSGGGGNYSHAAPPSTGVIAPILPATNQTVLANLSTVSQLYTNEVLTFTLRLTNSSTNAISLDSIINTLPSGFSYVTNSSLFNGSVAADPAINGIILTWSERYDVPAGSSRDLTFQARAVSSGYGTNSVVAFSKDTQIDTTMNTSDNSPATSVVRVLLAPTATNDSGSTQEDAPLTVNAPGLLANDNEPNGFPMTVLNYTQPANGSVTVSTNGAYTYTPTANYSGTDSFTYTLTNGNARSATATVNLTVTSVNDAPTLAHINSISIDQDASEQTVNLSGISAGATNESAQTITVTATSSNPGLIPDPTVVYTSPNSTGSLLFTPTPASNGVAVITVIVSDNGGVANGGISSVTNTFTVNVGVVTTVWAGGDSLDVHVKDAIGLPGTGYDRLSPAGSLDIQATAQNPFTINLISMQVNAPGLADNFDRDATNAWTIATTSSGVMGFDPAKFVINNAQFSNDLGGGTFTTELSGDGKSVKVVFLPNHTPVASIATYGRAWGTSLRIPISGLIATFTSDSDGDGRALAGFGSSTNGAAVTTNSTTIYFSATNNFPESFAYVIRDTRLYRVGDAVRFATNWFTVSITNAISLAQTISTSPGGIIVRFAGVPGYAYDIERTTNIVIGTWVPLLTTNAPTNGIWSIVDPEPPQPSAFYRTRQH